MRTKTSIAKELHQNGVGTLHITPDQVFQQRKIEVLGKRDRSSAGRIDFKAVHICAAINARQEYYTTSSCSGRSFLYVGQGFKATKDFWRFRVNHDIVRNAQRFFDLETLFDRSDLSGGGDPIPTIGQFEYKQKWMNGIEKSVENILENEDEIETGIENNEVDLSTRPEVWLRYEPFILHVCCRSLHAASELMNAARPSFKNVGLTTWKENNSYIVAIWGDDGLDMPMSTPEGTCIFKNRDEWLQSLVNERQLRNWEKISKFTEAVKEMDIDPVDMQLYESVPAHTEAPRSFDVIGDVAFLAPLETQNESGQAAIGEKILKKNKALKVCALRIGSLQNSERAPGESGIRIIAGIKRSPLITTHTEYGIKCVVDLENTFFSPRMGPERLRICQQVARGEHVCVLFSGCGMDALQIAGRTEANRVIAIELNPVAANCAKRGQRMLARNRAVKCAGADERLSIIEGDVLDILPTFDPNSFDRIVAPRPKEGALDGDLGTGDGGAIFLDSLLHVLKKDGGECHWYDFAAHHELPKCERTVKNIQSACEKKGLTMEIIHVAKVGSIAKKQYRVCVDFRLIAP